MISSFSEKEGRELVEDFRSNTLSSGPGNLFNSSSQAKKLFNLAGTLMEKLCEAADMSDVILAALYRAGNPYMEEGKSAIAVMKFYEFHNKKKVAAWKLRPLAEAVYRDFIVKKIGGGSCDHCSASVFLRLAETYPDQQIEIIRYQPKSTEDYEIQAPEWVPWHRSVRIRSDKEEGYVLDAWWPGGKVEKFDEKSYTNLESVVSWDKDQQDFVKALRVELEILYLQVMEMKKLEIFLKEETDEVKTYWTIEKKNL